MKNTEQPLSVSRCIILWLTFICSLFATASLVGRADAYCTPYFSPLNIKVLLLPLSLTTNSISIIGFSTICVWGVLFLIPQYYLCKSWLYQASSVRILPVVFLLHAILVTLYFALAAEISWQQAGVGLAVCLLLLALAILLNGPRQARKAVSFRYRLIKRWLRFLKATQPSEPEKPRRGLFS